MARRAVRSVVLAAAVAGLLALQAAAAVETPVEKQLQQEEQQLQLDEHIAGWSPFSIPAVDAVDINAYTGRWFQVYANALVAYTFELGGKCVTADYGLLDDGSGISVLNAQNMWKVTGNISTIEGRAFAPSASEPGQLQVEFDAVPFPGSYWIVKLGLVENGQYQYSVVTDSNGFTLFILARNVDDFKQRFEQEVLKFVEPLFQGFLRRPLATVQSPDCLYSAPPPPSTAEVEPGEQVRVPKPLVALPPQQQEQQRHQHQRLRSNAK